MEEDTKRLLKMYELMVLTRKYDELLIRLFKENKIPGFIHSGQGQEAIPVGACFDLRENDFVLMHHRGFGHCLAKGLDPERLAAEMCGKVTGYSGSLGACFPLSVGAALTAQYRKTGQVAVCFFGDGTANRELFHPSMNLAKIWNLPVVFVCENNRWAITVPIEKSTAPARISEKAKAHDVPGVTVDGNDVLAVNEAVNEAVKRARQGRGPSLVECTTFRWRPHAEGYPYFGAEKEAEEGQKHCPLQRARKMLIRAGVPAWELEGVDARIEERMRKTYDFAVNSPFPEPEKAWEGLYDGRER